MDAMIFSAGLGTRLRPITDIIPKVLVEVGGIPMLERVAVRLIEAGVTRLIINVHHHAEKIIDFVASRDSFGVETIISNESEELLDTGGGLKFAARHFRRDIPFLIYNGDILTDFDIEAFYRFHAAGDSLASLVTMHRDTSRYLLFDQEGDLCGYGNSATGRQEVVRTPSGTMEQLGFCGIHAVSPRIFDLIEEEGAFSILYPLYMRLIRNGESIRSFNIDGASWIDIGKIESLKQAEAITLAAGKRAGLVGPS